MPPKENEVLKIKDVREIISKMEYYSKTAINGFTIKKCMCGIFVDVNSIPVQLFTGKGCYESAVQFVCINSANEIKQKALQTKWRKYNYLCI